MSHKSIRKLIEDTVKNIRDDIDYSYGKQTDFNQARNDSSFFFVTTGEMSATAVYAVDGTYNFSKRWSVTMIFYKQDREDSAMEDYSLILDEVDEAVDRFYNDLNFFASKSEQILLTNFNQQPVIKATAHILTGFILSFQITAQDDFTYCRDC